MGLTVDYKGAVSLISAPGLFAQAPPPCPAMAPTPIQNP